MKAVTGCNSRNVCLLCVGASHHVSYFHTHMICSRNQIDRVPARPVAIVVCGYYDEQFGFSRIGGIRLQQKGNASRKYIRCTRMFLT